MQWLPLAEFVYGKVPHTLTPQVPFYTNLGFQPNFNIGHFEPIPLRGTHKPVEHHPQHSS